MFECLLVIVNGKIDCCMLVGIVDICELVLVVV